MLSNKKSDKYVKIIQIVKGEYLFCKKRRAFIHLFIFLVDRRNDKAHYKLTHTSMYRSSSPGHTIRSNNFGIFSIQLELPDRKGIYL